MTLVRLEGLRTPAFKNANASISPGLTVVIAFRDDAARALTRVVGGLDEPEQGRITTNGRSAGPARRRRLAVMLPEEQFDFATTVEEAIKSVLELRGDPRRVELILQPLGIEHLASLRTRALTARQSRQVSLALAMAHTDANTIVLYEPLLTLDSVQVEPFQRWLAEAAARACVVCVTTSLHDARTLGGPHAQLTAYGWEPLGVGARGAESEVIVLQGSNVRRLASELALTWPVRELALNLGESTDVLRVTGAPSDVSTRKLILAARSSGVTVTHIRAEAIAATDSWTDSPWLPSDSSTVTAPPRMPLRMLLSSAHREVRASMRESRAVTWSLFVALPSALALTYATALRGRHITWDSYESQVFVGTILTPLWSIGASWLIARRPANSRSGGLARYGVDRRWLALAKSAFAAAIVAFSAAAASVCATSYLASWRAVPPALVELYQYAWIAALGGAVYGAVAMYLSHFRRRWLFSWAFILLDAFLGGLNRSVALLFPRAHIHNLLGSPSSIDFSQPASCAVLSVTLALAIGLTLAKTTP